MNDTARRYIYHRCKQHEDSPYSQFSVLMFVTMVLLFFPFTTLAQDIICTKGYQPYSNRCITQRMADYISCIEASGGNREEISEEISELGQQKASTNIKASGSGVVAKGSASLILDKASERTLVKKIETKWFPKGMSECAKVLDKTTVREIKKAVQEATPQTSGLLVPGIKPTPGNLPCEERIPASNLILILGNSTSYTNTFPHTVIEVGTQPILVVDKKKNNISISARFFSKDGRIVAEIKNNKFFVNPNNYFRIERPNKHSLIVYDQQGDETLNIDFLNPSVVKLLAKFYWSNRPPIIINEDFQDLGTSVRMSKSCFGGNRVDIKID